MSATPWSDLMQCPSCGAGGEDLRRGPACSSCDTTFTIAGNCVTWKARTFDYAAMRRSAILRSAFNPVANPYSPIVRAVRRITDGYYRRTLKDVDLARRFLTYYLRGIDVGPHTCVLDHGCGRGRLIGLLTQLGAHVSGQDIVAHPWWHHFHACTFQVVPPEYRRLPWPAKHFDLVLDFGVIDYFDEEELGVLASEVHRTLRDPGYWVVWTANPTGRGAHARQTPYSHAHAVVERIGVQAGFHVDSLRFDGVAFRRFPVLLGALETIRRGSAFDYFSYGSLEAPVADQHKSKCLIVFTKSPRHEPV